MIALLVSFATPASLAQDEPPKPCRDPEPTLYVTAFAFDEEWAMSLSAYPPTAADEPSWKALAQELGCPEPHIGQEGISASSCTFVRINRSGLQTSVSVDLARLIAFARERKLSFIEVHIAPEAGLLLTSEPPLPPDDEYALFAIDVAAPAATTVRATFGYGPADPASFAALLGVILVVAAVIMLRTRRKAPAPILTPQRDDVALWVRR